MPYYFKKNLKCATAMTIGDEVFEVWNQVLMFKLRFSEKGSAVISGKYVLHHLFIFHLKIDHTKLLCYLIKCHDVSFRNHYNTQQEEDTCFLKSKAK